ncbi:hypothetical protein ABT127_24725 [Streptomyces sp. NPDC001904]|uniref:hypothetical protein n=1 Tax=Streptomyces sp. NPDC001904 TaxID=3154531 RepID=UPI0033176033
MLWSVLGTAIGGVLLSGCTPAQYPMIAGWLDDDGTPMVLAKPCGDDRVKGMYLLGSEPTESATSDSSKGHDADHPAKNTSWDANADPHRGGAFEFPLFDPPPAWRVSKDGTQRLEPGHDYHLMFYGGRGVFSSYNGIGGFSTEDLEGLKHGQVWAADRAMSRKEFSDAVADAC